MESEPRDCGGPGGRASEDRSKWRGRERGSRGTEEKKNGGKGKPKRGKMRRNGKQKAEVGVGVGEMEGEGESTAARRRETEGARGSRM